MKQQVVCSSSPAGESSATKQHRKAGIKLGHCSKGLLNFPRHGSFPYLKNFIFSSHNSKKYRECNHHDTSNNGLHGKNRFLICGEGEEVEYVLDSYSHVGQTMSQAAERHSYPVAVSADVNCAFCAAHSDMCVSPLEGREPSPYVGGLRDRSAPGEDPRGCPEASLTQVTSLSSLLRGCRNKRGWDSGWEMDAWWVTSPSVTCLRREHPAPARCHLPVLHRAVVAPGGELFLP